MTTVVSPALDLPAWPDDAIEVGRVVGAWGVKGGFRVQPYARDPQALFSTKRWFLQGDAALPRPPGVATTLPRLLRITQSREHGGVVVAQAQEVPDRNAAEALQGAHVFVARSSFPTAPTDEYYWVDLIGLDVVNRDDVALGTVTGLLDTGAHSVLRVRRAELSETVGSDEAEHLIPFVAAYIDSVDMATRRIRVDWGLDY